jgi:hypothetical protein
VGKKIVGKKIVGKKIVGKKIVGKKCGKRVWLWVELKNSGKKIVEKVKKVKKRSGYGLN